MSTYSENDYPLQKETFEIIGIAMEIHRILGKGFAEIVYKDALEFELKSNHICYEREKAFDIKYKDNVLPHQFNVNFVVFNSIIIEVKSKKGILEDHYTSVLNFLAVSKLQVGLILNFHEKSLEHKRVIFTR